jgi:NAD(P)H-hydrate repair Nnr-like enzyme with NAD(P)H-hydrate epimerase domain
MLAGEDPRDRAAERVRGEDVRARYVGRLQQGDEVVDALLGTGRLGHRVAPAKGLVEVGRRVRTRDEQDGG